MKIQNARDTDWKCNRKKSRFSLKKSLRILSIRRIDKRPFIFASFIIISILCLSLFSYNSSKAFYIEPDINKQPINKIIKSETLSLKIPSKEKLTGFIKKGETLLDFTKKYDVKSDQLLNILEAAKSSYDLKALQLDRSYQILIDRVNNNILEFKYSTSDYDYLKVKFDKEENVYNAEKIGLPNKKTISVITGQINNSLIESLGGSKEHMNLAFDLADLFSYDIDFTDLKKGDSFAVVLEELYVDSFFKGFGNILFASFTNDGKTYELVKFTIDGKTDYFRADGSTLKKTLMRAPLMYRYVSSTFTNSRFHPILKIYRPHHGVDYVAPTGTPVSAAGDGKVTFRGWKNGYGNFVTIKHEGGYETCYGHLSKFGEDITAGSTVTQGQIIGYVGQTGYATGPHLDYRVSLNGEFLNPLTMTLPAIPISAKHLSSFNKYVSEMKVKINDKLASAKPRKKPKQLT
ncbi:metalloendopeptidase-like membrane protein [Candidatus Magnetoovum chiemensis]|nr:metalloendopeptidase-like membrane protein [Candidatus Magnetoovum chiemensis]